MSTHLGFDLAGLIAAIERGDLDYQLALYAPDAQLRVVDVDPSRSVSLYHGKSEIQNWLQRPDQRQSTHRLVELGGTDNGISLTDLIRHPDGRNLIYDMSLQLDRGHIASQSVTLTWEDQPG